MELISLSKTIQVTKQGLRLFLKINCVTLFHYFRKISIVAEISKVFKNDIKKIYISYGLHEKNVTIRKKVVTEVEFFEASHMWYNFHI